MRLPDDDAVAPCVLHIEQAGKHRPARAAYEPQPAADAADGIRPRRAAEHEQEDAGGEQRREQSAAEHERQRRAQPRRGLAAADLVPYDLQPHLQKLQRIFIGERMRAAENEVDDVAVARIGAAFGKFPAEFPVTAAELFLLVTLDRHIDAVVFVVGCDIVWLSRHGSSPLIWFNFDAFIVP